MSNSFKKAITVAGIDLLHCYYKDVSKMIVETTFTLLVWELGGGFDQTTATIQQSQLMFTIRYSHH